MDKVYTADIPKNYKYIRNVTDSYFDLYNVSTLQYNRTYDFYRVYYTISPGFYQLYNTTYTSQYSTQLIEIAPTADIHSRRDIGTIYFVFFVWVIIICSCVNLATTIIRKGGLLNGFFK